MWASVDGRPVGTLRILDNKDHLVIGRVAVDAAYRGLHIGRRMVNLALEIAHADGRDVSCTLSRMWRTGTAIVDLSSSARTLRRLGSITSRWFCVAKAA
ncbi:acetyltransferase family protein [Cutibacterium acnes JCM 18920]|nr:acetyltransferase family protein [Cutibacterium acnes JCM 18920]